MRSPRMTTRRWMIGVMAVALAIGSYIHASRWYDLRTRYVSALREYSVHERFYEEGRVTALRFFEKSQDLMEAQVALCFTKAGRSAVVSAHLNRAANLIKREESELEVCSRGVSDVEEIRYYLVALRKRMKGMVGPP